jgi:predicted permease
MFAGLRYRLRAIFQSKNLEAELDEELRYHFERQVEQLRAQGHDEAEALRRARLEFGALDQRKDECRDQRGITWLETAAREFRHAFRALLRRPGFSLGVVGMLALGIGGNLALFSVFNGLFLKPLPIERPEEIVDVNTAAPKWNLERTGVNYFDFHNWRLHNRSFSALAIYDEVRMNVAFSAEPLRLRGLQVTHDLPQVLRVQPAFGRFFTPEEDRPNANRVALISHRIWQEQFGGQANVLGQGIRLDGSGFAIVGVLPAGLRLPIEADFWIPLGETPIQKQSWYLDAIGRLHSGISVAKATEDLTRIHKSIPDEMMQLTFPVLKGIRELSFGEMRSYSLIVLFGVGIVLLIACVNIAGLMLVRAQNRRHEMSIRAALGASRWQLSREWLAEAVLLASGGAIGGLAIGFAGLCLIVYMIPENALPTWVSFHVDWRFATFTLALAVSSALFFGAFPALRASRAALQNQLADAATRSSASRTQRRGLNGLVVSEVALAAVLLVSAAFLGKALWDLSHVNPGFRACIRFPCRRTNTQNRNSNELFLTLCSKGLKLFPLCALRRSSRSPPWAATKATSFWWKGPGHLPPAKKMRSFSA